jgi:hypothetical protein
MNTKDIEDLIKGQFTKSGKFQKMVKLDAAKPVKAISSKLSDHNINIRIRDSKGIPDFAKQLGCQPRTKTDGKPPFFLPEVLIKNFDLINSGLSKWLAQSKDNSKIFLENPVKAIELTGIKMDRITMKEISKVHKDTIAKTLVSPDVNKMNVAVEYKKGFFSPLADIKTTSK